MNESAASMNLQDASRSGHTRGTVVAVGKFEGLHRGHRVIIDRVRRVALENDLASAVLTFRNNPLAFLDPENCPKPVMSPGQREATLRELGVDYVHMVDFDQEFASKTPRQFVETYLVDALHAKHVIVGDDFKFGATASGTTDTLAFLGNEFDFSVEVIDEVTDSEVGRVSSTKIREMLMHGDVAAAARLLDQWHTVVGLVVHGDARGRDLGFPTANLGPREGESVLEGFVPGDGVYAGFAVIDGDRHMAAISVGNNPTFTPDADPRVEVFLLDFAGDVYGKEIRVLFVEKVRDNERFDELEALIDQMHRDIAQIRDILETLTVNHPRT